MAYPTWITPKGSLGSVAEAEYFEYQIDAYCTCGSSITFSLISGKLPTGIQLQPSGVLKGIPIVALANDVELAYTSRFTIRATNLANEITDRTFTITINSIVPPQILPRYTDLGTYYDGHYLNTQLIAIDPNPDSIFEWTVTSGALPPGVTLDNNGLLSGYLGRYVEPGVADVGWGDPIWDSINWDASATSQNQRYTFSVRVFDGNNYAQAQYSVVVLAKSLMTVDLDYLTVDTDHFTVDTDNRHQPILTTVPQSMPVSRQNSQFAFKFEGLDLDGDHLSFKVLSGAVPTGLVLDPTSGWLTGKLLPQIEDEKVYTFQVICYKTDYLDSMLEPQYPSMPVTFTMHVLGDISNYISWVSAPYLGAVHNGSLSEFQIFATTPSKQKLVYKLKPEFAGRLPRGLSLLPSGLIVGRVSFQHFSLDGGTTTFDDLESTFDSEYTFTVVAHNQENSLSSEQSFTIGVIPTNVRPYENIYLKAALSRDQREVFGSVITNTDIFPDELIYRPGDLFFGKSENIKFLAQAGLEPSSALDYFNAVEHNHYTKKIILGDVKTAIALDENFNVKYEVVYVDVLDDLDNNGKTPAKVIDLSSKIENPYQYGNDEFTTIYPNDFANMRKQMATEIGFSHRGVLPDWMLDKQPGGRVLGFTRAVVLAYTVPGASNLIAYRLKSNGIVFSDLDFTVDRYQLDNYLSTHYDLDTGAFTRGGITTFDVSIEPAETTFDGDRTEFSGDIDKYGYPESNDKYIKYRQNGVFH